MDYESERMVRKVLENVTRNKPKVLIIAHKLNTIKSGDFIVKLQHGVIVEVCLKILYALLIYLIHYR